MLKFIPFKVLRNSRMTTLAYPSALNRLQRLLQETAPLAVMSRVASVEVRTKTMATHST
jgi:hypothetical protein